MTDTKFCTNSGLICAPYGFSTHTENQTCGWSPFIATRTRRFLVVVMSNALVSYNSISFSVK